MTTTPPSAEAATTLTAEDVRRAVAQDCWCPKCQDFWDDSDDATFCGGERLSPLFARCPDCQPEEMRFTRIENDVLFITLDTSLITPANAASVILQSIARSGTAAYQKLLPVFGLGQTLCRDYAALTTAIMHGEFEDAVKWRHRLKDLENVND